VFNFIYFAWSGVQVQRGSITAKWLAAERAAIEDEGGKERSLGLMDDGSGYDAVLIRGMTTIYKSRESNYRGGCSSSVRLASASKI